MKITTLKLNKTTGKKTLAKATDVFSYINPDFKKYTEKEKPTKEMNVDVFQMEKDGTFKDIFGENDLATKCFTQEQIIDFCKNHKDSLILNWYTLFLFKADKDFFVAGVYRLSDGTLGLGVYAFSCALVWYAECGHRFVLPQLNLESSETLPLGDLNALTLESAMKLIKENGYKIIKEY